MTVMFYLSLAITWLLVLVVPLFNERKRTLHDLISGVVVVRHSRLAAGAYQAF